MKISMRMLIIYFFILATTSLCPMQQGSISTYSLIKKIQPQYVTSKISFIKQLMDKSIVIFDENYRGELFDKDFQFGYRLDGPKTACVYNAYNIVDNDGIDCLVAQGGTKLTIHNLSIQNNIAGHVSTKHIKLNQKNPVSLWQRPDGSLFIRPFRKDVELNLSLSWKDALYNSCTVGSEIRPIEESICINEGLVVPAVWYEEHPTIRLLNVIFSPLLSGPEQFRQEISCYHKTLDGTIFIGHKDGTISIWRLSTIL